MLLRSQKVGGLNIGSGVSAMGVSYVYLAFIIKSLFKRISYENLKKGCVFLLGLYNIDSK